MNSHIRYAHIRIWMGYLHPIMFYTKLLARMNRNNIIAWLSSNMTSALILFCGKIVGRVNYLWDRVIISLCSPWYCISTYIIKLDTENDGTSSILKNFDSFFLTFIKIPYLVKRFWIILISSKSFHLFPFICDNPCCYVPQWYQQNNHYDFHFYSSSKSILGLQTRIEKTFIGVRLAQIMHKYERRKYKEGGRVARVWALINDHFKLNFLYYIFQREA